MTKPEDGDGLLSRPELEIELARPALTLERKWPTAEATGPAPEAVTAWFQEAATGLLERLAPELRPFCFERLQQIARSNAGRQLTKLEPNEAAMEFKSGGGHKEGATWAQSPSRGTPQARAPLRRP